MRFFIPQEGQRVESQVMHQSVRGVNVPFACIDIVCIFEGTLTGTEQRQEDTPLPQLHFSCDTLLYQFVCMLKVKSNQVQSLRDREHRVCQPYSHVHININLAREQMVPMVNILTSKVVPAHYMHILYMRAETRTSEGGLN